jgi:hypothetical protein
MEHPNELPFDYFNGKSKKMGLRGVVTKKIRCNNDCMDINNARVWIVHYLTTTEDESCRVT